MMCFGFSHVGSPVVFAGHIIWTKSETKATLKRFAQIASIAECLPRFVHPKLPLAARLGLCWGARPSRLPFSASRRKPVSQTERFHRSADCPNPQQVARKTNVEIFPAVSRRSTRCKLGQ